MKYVGVLIIFTLICCFCRTQQEMQRDYALLMETLSLEDEQKTLLVKKFIHYIDSLVVEPIKRESNLEECLGCKTFFLILGSLDQPLLKVVEDILIDYQVKKCLQDLNFTEDVCRKYQLEMTPLLIESMYKHYFNPEQACSFIKVCPQTDEPLNIDELVADILEDKPHILPQERARRGDESGQNILRILHITDIHLDLGYLEGTAVTCKYPICCRDNIPGEQISMNQDELSGYWGTLGQCDLPERTLDQFLAFVNKQVDVDLIMWTGDNVSHDEENSELVRNFNRTKLITDKFIQHFTAPVIGSLGNNDASPDYIYDFQENLDTKLQEDTSEIWKQWIDPNARDMLKLHGFFSTHIPHFPNLKVISLNTFACTEKNYLLMTDPTDPGHQLQWLRRELEQSEKLGESVYIIGHIPVNMCSQTWGRVYNALAERFQGILKGQLFGHTHSDYFTLQGSANNEDDKIGVQFVAPPMTSYGKHNPSFRVFEVNALTYEILDFHQYRLNLQKYNAIGPAAILTGGLNWDIVYSFKSNYNLEDLSLYSLNKLRMNLASKNVIYDNAQMNYLTQYSAPSQFDKRLYCLSTAFLFEQLATCNNQEPYPTFQSKIIDSIIKNWRKRIHS